MISLVCTLVCVAGDAIVFSDEYHVADAFKVTVHRKGQRAGLHQHG